MKKLNCMVVALALLALILVPAAASAADRVYWSGKADGGYRYSFNNTSGDNWTIRMTGGGKEASATYKEVTRTEEFIEVRDPSDKDERARIYKDKVQFWSKSAGRWQDEAKGKWGN